jgi:hypothetical protein
VTDAAAAAVAVTAAAVTAAAAPRRSRYLELVTAMLVLMHEQMDHPLRRMLRKLRGGDRKKVRGSTPVLQAVLRTVQLNII